MNSSDSEAAKRNLSALVDFSNYINSSLDLKFILNNLLLTCFGKFHTTRGLVAIFNDFNELNVAAAKGIPENVLREFPKIRAANGEYDEAVIEQFREKAHLHFCRNIVSTQGLRGVVFLGERLDKVPYSAEDKNFLETIVNIAATAIENSITFEQLKSVNRSLDSKVSMLSALFDLSKEFSGILDTARVCKLLVYSIIGQLFVSNYAVAVYEPGGISLLECNYPSRLLLAALKDTGITGHDSPLTKVQLKEEYPDMLNLGIELLIPMQIKGETKGLILLGKRLSQAEYSESDIEFIYSLGNLAMISIENSRLFKDALEKQRMEEDLEIARDIQKNLLPQFMPKMKNFEISAVNISSKQVGGDYYDLIKLDKFNCLIAIGDVAGKGVPASLLMANLQAFLKSITRMKLELNEATNLINDLVSENTAMGNFITFFWGILNDETRSFTYVNAGHNPPMLIRNGDIIKLTKGGMILGVVKTITPYLSETMELQSGDLLVLYTDGVTEAMNKQMEEFTEARLEEIVRNIHDKPASDILLDIRKAVELFADGANQSDDITLMIIRVK